MNPEAGKPCAVCGYESNFACAACTVIRYCSPICRDKNLRQHRSQCGGLLHKPVERIGETLREIFYVFSERAYNTKIVSIAKGSDAVLISEGFNDVQRSRQVLFAFPVMPTSDLRDRHAVLCVHRSEHALGYLHDFLAQMLKGELSNVRHGCALSLT